MRDLWKKLSFLTGKRHSLIPRKFRIENGFHTRTLNLIFYSFFSFSFKLRVQRVFWRFLFSVLPEIKSVGNALNGLKVLFVLYFAESKRLKKSGTELYFLFHIN